MKRHPMVALFVLLAVLLGVPGAVALEVSYRNQQAIASQADRNTTTNQRLVDFQVANKVDGCRSSNHGRKALQSVLDAAAHPPPTSASSVDFSKIDGWSALPPTTQFFLTNLQTQLARPGGSIYLAKIAADYRRTNPSNVNCASLGRQLRGKLDASN